MSNEYGFYGGIPPHSNDTTSLEAARQIRASAGATRRIIFDAIKRCRAGATCDEIEVGLRLAHQTASARIRELALSHTIKDSGMRRPTRSGRNAIIWVANVE